MTTQRSMLVTGGSSGLGLAIARAAAADGYRVGVLDPAVPAGGNGASHLRHFAVSVSDEAGVDATVDDFGTPDVVVNNAGIVRFGPLAVQSLADFREVLDVNLVGTFIVSRAAARR